MQISIEAFGKDDIETLAKISRETFVQSHGHSADAEAISAYVNAQFTTTILSEAIQDPTIHYSKIRVDGALAGYSKLILNSPNTNTKLAPIAKFERVYLLKKYYGLGLGKALLTHNLNLAQQHQQKALWLYVWTENDKGLAFYKKHDFKTIGTHDFKISTNHYNPNYVMLKVI